MVMPGRNYSNSGYRYGFNGKEDDKDITSGSQDYGMRVYDKRIAKFLSVDPLFKGYPWYSPYHSAGNNPIRNIDLDGGEPLDYVEKWVQKTLVINDKRRTGEEVESDGTLRSYSYRAVYDHVTKQHWFVMQYPNDPTYYYWKHKDGADPNRLIQSTTGIYDNGHWESFETANSRRARVGAESARLLEITFAALFTLPFAVQSYASMATVTGTTYIGRGVFDASTDVAAQLATNGGSVKDINRTSVALAFLIPGHSWKRLVLKNAVGNYAKWDGDGYKGIGSEGYTSDNFKRDFVNTVYGTFTEKIIGEIGNRPTANTGQIDRWTRLSYKPKYANLLNRNTNIVSTNSFFNSWQGKTLGGMVNGVINNVNNTSSQTPKQDPSQKLGFH